MKTWLRNRRSRAGVNFHRSSRGPASGILSARRVLMLVAASPWLVSSCNGAAPTAPKSNDTTFNPAMSCSALAAALSLPDTTIKSVSLYSSGKKDLFFPDAGPQPENCVVKGEVGAYTGIKDPITGSSSYGIQFELRMPTAWNGRFFYQGGGAGDGIVFPADGVIPSQAGTLSGVEGFFSPETPALWRGFAVVSTDGGHEEIPLSAGFGVDPQARINYGYASIGAITPIAKQIIATYFGQQPHHSYFLGCSKGGQEAMEASQKYGDEFDGIVAADPGYRITHADMGITYSIQALATAAHANKPESVDGNGNPLLYNAFSYSDLELVRKGVLKACDALDGVADGMIFNTTACLGKFNPASLQCSGAKKSSCLTATQVNALNEIYAGPKAVDGTPLYASFPYDTGLSSFDGWRVWMLGFPGVKNNFSLDTTLAQSILQYINAAPPDPSLSLFTSNVDDQLAMISATTTEYPVSAESYMDATSPDLDTFEQHGGKIIFTHGASDPAFSMLDTVAYYNQLNARYGSAASNFTRLYIVPGMNHCAGGDYTTDSFDTLDALVGWVEQGVAPTSLIASVGNPQISKLPVGITRPLCPYPQYAKYQSGDVNNASSFKCAAP